MTQEQQNLIDKLSDNVAKVQSLHIECRNDNIRLKKRIEALLNKLSEKDRSYEELSKKYESLKLAKVIATSSVDSHDAKIKLNRIVREVDKCISLLNK